MDADPTNQLLWRMNPRRMDIEAYRDSMLQISGTLDRTMYGPSEDLDTTTRRTLYSALSRTRSSADVLKLYDVPPRCFTFHALLTINPLQALFVMNSGFIQTQASALAKAVANTSTPEEKVARSTGRSSPGMRMLKKWSSASRTSWAGCGALCPGAARHQRGDLLAMISRREALRCMCGGFGMLGLADLLAGDAFGAAVHTSGPHFAPRARHVILLFMTGGPSHVDLWDPKPALMKYAGQRPATADLRTERTTAGLMPSTFAFAKRGKSGVEMSELLPNLSTVADELCVIRSMFTTNPNHEQARSMFHQGA